mmetsp:Transcript_103921/g.324810  ORF Transcript_103921/g.324810 Transcript_103921/m.324810 type:complete len:141 (-) Transcript_103921:132-554(-)
MAGEAPPMNAAHQSAKEMGLARGFLSYVQHCPHIMQSVKAFMAEHAAAFADLGETDEHKLEYTEIHRRYLDLLDSHVAAFLKFQGATEEDFLQALASAQEGDEQEWRPFKALLNKTDYYTFAKMMQVQANGVGPRGPPPE